MIDVKNFVETLNGKPVAVFGLGASGLSVIKALKKSGVQVFAWDDKAGSHEAAEKAGAELVSLTEEKLAGCACLILAPGVPLHHPAPHPVVDAARRAGVEIIGDIEILHRCDHGRRTIGITGTNGKSTTTALLGHILNSCGIKIEVGGNIGKPVMDLKIPANDGVFVLELSSFQLDLCPTFRPDISALINITPDHIDRHGSMEDYVASKERIFEGDGVAIIGIDDKWSEDVLDRAGKTGTRRIIPVSNSRKAEGGVYVMDEILWDDTRGENLEVGSLHGITTLHGLHNKQNVAVAYAVCREFSLAPEAILEAIRSYPGLPHRQYPVRVINGVIYINDSKATNAEAAGKALACHNNIYWIVGGRPKEGGLSGLEPFIGNICHAFLIGEAMEDFSEWVVSNDVPHSFSRSLDVAVQQAHSMAQEQRGKPGGSNVVLLSPACASFDQFKSFEARGEYFMELVNALPEEMAA